MSNIKPGGQNQPGEDSKPTNWMVLETEHLDIYICVFKSFTDFPDDKEIPRGYPYKAKLIKL